MPDKEKSEKRWDNNEAEAISDLMIVILLVSVSLSANSSTKGLHKSILRQTLTSDDNAVCVCAGLTESSSRLFSRLCVSYCHHFICTL